MWFRLCKTGRRVRVKPGHERAGAVGRVHSVVRTPVSNIVTVLTPDGDHFGIRAEHLEGC